MDCGAPPPSAPSFESCGRTRKIQSPRTARQSSLFPTLKRACHPHGSHDAKTHNEIGTAEENLSSWCGFPRSAALFLIERNNRSDGSTAESREATKWPTRISEKGRRGRRRIVINCRLVGTKARRLQVPPFSELLHRVACDLAPDMQRFCFSAPDLCFPQTLQ